MFNKSLTRIALAVSSVALLMLAPVVVLGEAVISPKDQAVFSARITKECGTLKRRFEALNCSNDISAEYGIEPDGRVIGEWVILEDIDPITDQANVAVITDSSSENSDSTLAIRCFKGKTDLILSWPYSSVLPSSDEPVDVQTRIDETESTTSTWHMAKQTHNAMFHKQNTIECLKGLVGGDKLVVEVVSTDGAGVLQFNIAELKSAIAPLRAACDW